MQLHRLFVSIRHRPAKLMLMCVLSCASFCSPLYADEYVERQLKIAYIVNVTKFVRWPERPAIINLCFWSSSSMTEFVDEIRGADLGDGATISVVIDPRFPEQCHLAYWDAPLRSIGQEENQVLLDPSVLTITDQSNGLKSSFAVQFFIRDLKLRMTFNEAILAVKDYEVSSNLLRLSRKLN